MHGKLFLASATIYAATLLPALSASDAWDVATVTSNACLVADSYISRHFAAFDPKALQWENAAFWNGLVQLALSDRSLRYHDYLVDFGRKMDWGYRSERPYHADMHCIGQTWLELAMADDQPGYADKIRELFDYITRTAPAVSDTLDMKAKGFRRWTWCDALFMSPTVMHRMSGFTGDAHYRNFADAEYQATTKFLYNSTDHLFHRDSSYFKTKSADGSNVYWSRGNGWVFGSLAIILRDLPPDSPSRPFYENLFREMAVSIKACQQPDGTWHSSLKAPNEPAGPEMSGTCFFTYGYLWGLNNGYLDEQEYLGVVQKAWQAITAAIKPNGLLGYMQRIAASPSGQSMLDSEEAPYGAGAFISAAMELKTWLTANAHRQALVVRAENPQAEFRPAETVEIALAPNGIAPDGIRVYDTRNHAYLPHQLWDGDGDGKPDTLLFSTYFLAGATRKFLVFNDASAPDASQDVVCVSQYAPHRLDDYLWENDRFALRTYGHAITLPPPAGQALVSSGIDVFVKCVPQPKLYTWTMDNKEKHYNYHKNLQGEGMDNYLLGVARGCGGLAAFDGSKWMVSSNWVLHTDKVVANGPVRSAFEIAYAPWYSSETEVRHCSFDRGQSFCKMEVAISKLPEGMKIGPGLDVTAKRNHAGDIALSSTENWIANFEPRDGDMGSIETAILLAPGFAAEIATESEGCLVLLTQPVQDKLTWYLGTGWDLAGHARSAAEWTKRVRTFSAGLKAPLKITTERK